MAYINKTAKIVSTDNEITNMVHGVCSHCGLYYPDQCQENCHHLEKRRALHKKLKDLKKND